MNNVSFDYQERDDNQSLENALNNNNNSTTGTTNNESWNLLSQMGSMPSPLLPIANINTTSNNVTSNNNHIDAELQSIVSSLSALTNNSPVNNSTTNINNNTNTNINKQKIGGYRRSSFNSTSDIESDIVFNDYLDSTNNNSIKKPMTYSVGTAPPYVSNYAVNNATSNTTNSKTSTVDSSFKLMKDKLTMFSSNSAKLNNTNYAHTIQNVIMNNSNNINNGTNGSTGFFEKFGKSIIEGTKELEKNNNNNNNNNNSSSLNSITLNQIKKSNMDSFNSQGTLGSNNLSYKSDFDEVEISNKISGSYESESSSTNSSGLNADKLNDATLVDNTSNTSNSTNNYNNMSNEKNTNLYTKTNNVWNVADTPSFQPNNDPLNYQLPQQQQINPNSSSANRQYYFNQPLFNNGYPYGNFQQHFPLMSNNNFIPQMFYPLNNNNNNNNNKLDNHSQELPSNLPVNKKFENNAYSSNHPNTNIDSFNNIIIPNEHVNKQNARDLNNENTSISNPYLASTNKKNNTFSISNTNSISMNKNTDKDINNSNQATYGNSTNANHKYNNNHNNNHTTNKQIVNNSNTERNSNAVDKRKSANTNNKHNGNVVNTVNSYHRSALLEEIRNNNDDNQYKLIDIINHVLEFCRDQYGSRFVQKELATAADPDKEVIFDEIKDCTLELSNDVFGNYVIQKFFEFGTKDQIDFLVNTFSGKIKELSMQMYACRVIQRALEFIEPEQRYKFVIELKGNVLKMIKDQNGNHVIQKAIEKIEIKKISFVLDSLIGHIYNLATHTYGCRVVQRLLKYGSLDNKNTILIELVDYIPFLIQDQYGNYVIQYILQTGSDDANCLPMVETKQKIINIVAENVVDFSKHKFASNVVEKAILFGDVEQKEFIISHILPKNKEHACNLEDNAALILMIKDQFANYVVQKLVSISEGEEKKLIVIAIRSYLDKLNKSNNAGNRHLASVEKLATLVDTIKI